MYIGIPQIIYIILTIISVSISLSKYGQPKIDNYDIHDVITGPVLSFLLLYWGGFFG